MYEMIKLKSGQLWMGSGSLQRKIIHTLKANNYPL